MLTGQLAQRRPDGEQLLLAALAGLLDGGARLGGLLERGLETGQHDAGADQDRLGGPALARHPLAALELAGPGLALGLGGAQQLVGAAVQRAGALLGGAQRQPRLGLGRCRASRASSTSCSRASSSGSAAGSASARASRPSSSASPDWSCSRAASASSIARVSRSASAAGGAHLGPELAELLGHRGERGVGLVQLGERDVDPLLRVVPLVVQPGHVEGEPLGRGDGLGELGGRLVDGGLDLEQARLARRAAGRDVGAEQVAVERHRGELGVLRDQAARRR